MKRRESNVAKIKTYKINEVFFSIQGEGSFTGMPMVFVRFSGCNLSCSFCDTKHQRHSRMTGEEIEQAILHTLSHLPTPVGVRVCFTGGEPTLQLDDELILRLCGKFNLHLETNGTRTPPCLGVFEAITVSPKKRLIEMNWIPGNTLLHSTEGNKDLKIVWDTQDHMLMQMVRDWEGFGWRRRYIQPCWRKGKANYQEAVEFVQSHPEWSLSVQMQRILCVR